MGWQRTSGYNQRARVEGQSGRFKQVIGDRLRFHHPVTRANESAIAVAVAQPDARPGTAEFRPR